MIVEMKKTDGRFLISNAVISLDVSKGHLKWKVADLARLTKLSRSLIYYHFGRSKADILTNAFSFIAEEFYGLTADRMQLLKEGKIAQSLLRTRHLYLKNPSLAVFYLRWRSSKSPLQKQMIHFENRYQAKLKSLFPNCSPLEITIVHGLFHGLVTSPFLTDGEIEAAVGFIVRKKIKFTCDPS